MTTSELNWTKLGHELRVAALDAHEGELPIVDEAYKFLLSNPECFGYEEWPANIPAWLTVDHIQVIGAYYGL